MDNDDQQIGHILSRREVLALLGATGGAAFLARGRVMTATGVPTAVLAARFVGSADVALAQQTSPSCVVRPELTEGPYFVDEQLNRSDIRMEPSDGSVKEGIPFVLTRRRPRSSPSRSRRVLGHSATSRTPGS